MKEQELTSRMADVIVALQGFDEASDFRHHKFMLSIASQCSSVIREFNQLVAELREHINRDPTKLPDLIEPPKVEYEN